MSDKLFSKKLHNKSEIFVEKYRNYYRSYSLWVDTKSYRDDLPDWRNPWGKNKKRIIIDDIPKLNTFNFYK